MGKILVKSYGHTGPEGKDATPSAMPLPLKS